MGKYVVRLNVGLQNASLQIQVDLFVQMQILVPYDVRICTFVLIINNEKYFKYTFLLATQEAV